MRMERFLFLLMMLMAGCSSTKKVNKTNSGEGPPKLLKPIVKKIWIPAEIRNGGAEWVEGHFMYRVEKETTWSR